MARVWQFSSILAWRIPWTGGTWLAAVQGVAGSWTQLNNERTKYSIFFFKLKYTADVGFASGSAGKGSACSVRDLGLIPGLGISPEEGKGYPLQ